MVLESSRLSTYIDALQIILSLLLVGFAVWFSWDGPETEEEPQWMTTTELIFTFLFTIDYFAHFYAAEDRCAFVTSFFAIIDAITILPVYLQWYINASTQDNPGFNQVDQLQSQFLGPLRVLRALRILRAYRILSFTKSAVQRQLFLVLLTVVSVIVCTTGIIQALEFNADPRSPTGQSLRFLEAMYFIVVTITTVGFGDVAPKSELGRVTIMGMITASMIIIPTQVSKLSALLAQRSAYDGEYKARGRSHVLVCGDPPAHTLVYFLHEFFNASSKMTSERVVIMGREAPSYELKRLLQRPALEARVTFYRGNAMLNSDLYRAKVHKAKAAFVMLSTRQEDYEQLDTAASLVTSSIRAFTSRRERKGGQVRCPVYTQVMASSNVRHAQLAGASEVLGTQRLKYSTLALSATIPGFSTLLTNLLTTLVRPDMSGEPEWLQEYSEGSQHEIYAAAFPIGMHGLKFFTAAEMIKQEIGALLIGVETPSPTNVPQAAPEPKGIIASALSSVRPRPALQRQGPDNQRVIRLAPVDYYVDGTGCDRALLLCTSATLAEDISKLTVNKVKGYKIVQNYFRDSFRSSRRFNNLSKAIQTKQNDHWGWKAVKEVLQKDGVDLMKRIAKSATPMNRGVKARGRTKSRQRISSRSAAYTRQHTGGDAAAMMPMINARKRRIQAIARADKVRALTVAANDSFKSAGSPVHAIDTLNQDLPDLGLKSGSNGGSATSSAAPSPMSGAQVGGIAAGNSNTASNGSNPQQNNAGAGAGEGEGEGEAAASSGDTLSPLPVVASRRPTITLPPPRPGAALWGALSRPSTAGTSALGSLNESGRTDGTGEGPAPEYHRPMLNRNLHQGLLAANKSFRAMPGTRADPLPNANYGRESMTAAYTAFLMKPVPFDLEQHIIVCGLPDDLDDFISPLRSRDKPGTSKPLIILSLRKPTMRSFSKVMNFPNLFYLVGSPRDAVALKECGVRRASTVVVLSNPSRSDTDPLLSEDDLMVDADAMTTLRYILEITESQSRPPKVIVEMLRGSNIKFVNYQRPSLSASSATYLDAVEDSEDDEDDFNRLRHGTGEMEVVLRPAFASGQVCTSNMIEALLGAAFHKPYVVRCVELLISGDTSAYDKLPRVEESKAMYGSADEDEEPESSLHVMNMPEWAHGQTFIQVFVRLLRRNRKVVVAVYRSGTLASVPAPAPYIYTNPRPDAVLSKRDKLIVLGQLGVQQREAGGGDFASWR